MPWSLKIGEQCIVDLSMSELSGFADDVQRPTHSEEEAPVSNLLPPNVKQFLAQSMAWTQSVVEECWDVFRDIIWTYGMDLELHPIQPPVPHDLVYFEKYGHPLLLGMFMLCGTLFRITGCRLTNEVLQHTTICTHRIPNAPTLVVPRQWKGSYCVERMGQGKSQYMG
jgi:hypothetical protein